MFYPQLARPPGLIGVLEFSPIRHLGLMSYSAYLVHQPVLALYRWGTGLNVTTFEKLFLCAVILTIAHISWKYVEAPYRSPRK